MFTLRRPLVFIAIGALAAAGACSSARTDAGQSQVAATGSARESLWTSDLVTVPPSRSTVAPGTFSPPAGLLAVFDAGSAERYVLGAAIDRLIGRCMEQAGFGVTVGVHDAEATNARPFWEANFGLFDPTNAALNGYQLPASTTDEETPQASELSAEYLSALQGAGGEPVDIVDPVTGHSLGQVSEPGGCMGRAIEELYGSFDAYRGYVAAQLSLQRSSYELLERVRASDEFIALTRQWSACMAARGYEYSSVFDPARTPWPTPQSEVELATATADVTCKEQIGMKEGIAATLTSELEAAEESTRDLFAEFSSSTVEFLERAESIG